LSTSLSDAEAPPVAGVDPRLVFKVSAAARLTDANFENKGLHLLGEADGWEYFVLPAEEDAATLRKAIEEYTASADGRTFFDKVEGLLPYDSDDRRGRGIPDDLAEITFPLVVDIHLWPAGDRPEAQRRLADVRAIGSEELGSDEQPAFLVVRARVDRTQLENLLQLSAVERVQVPPVPYLSPAEWVGELVENFDQPPPRGGVVGVIDDGIADGHALLAGLVTSLEVPSDRVWAPPGDHGTMVAGLAAYGDFESALRDGSKLPSPIQVVAARVVEPPAPGSPATFPTSEPEHLILEKAIRALAGQGARVVNISIADRDGYAGPHVDERTETLDRLSRELDLVIVACSGNIALVPDIVDLHAEHPTHLLADNARVAEPAVAATAITVGSVARSEQGAHSDGESPPDMRAVARADEVSPFSRSGPGFIRGAVKPDVVAYGGNSVSQAVLSSRTHMIDNPGAGALSLAVPGPFAVSSGTSFAAPRVARIAAVVRDEYPEASANLTRCLVGISSRVPPLHRPVSSWQAEQRHEHLRFAGYGMPDEVRAIESVSQRVVMTFDGEIATDTSVIHEIPVPEEFANGTADRSISIALAFDPPTRRFRREYLAARMKFDLYRAIDLDDLIEIVGQQPSEGGHSLPGDRRRVSSKLFPSSEAVLRSALQVRRWRAAVATSLLVDDGDTYYLVVTHISEPWAERAQPDYDSQAYAIAVELEDRTRHDVNVLERVQQRAARARARA
jgi:subtilisin family serine protease